MLFDHTHLVISSREIYEDKDGYIQTYLQLNGAKGRRCLGPTYINQGENPKVNDVAVTDVAIVHILLTHPTI